MLDKKQLLTLLDISGHLSVHYPTILQEKTFVFLCDMII